MGFILPAIPAIASLFTTSAAASTGAAAAAGMELASIPIAASAASSSALAYASLGATALGGLTGAYGAIQGAEASAAASRYNAAVNEQNAAIAKRNEEIASQSGMQQEALQQQKTRAQVGEILTNQAASGLDVSTGSPLDVRTSARTIGALDAMTTRANAIREAYGYQSQEASFKAASALELAEADSAETAGIIEAGSTLLGSAGTAMSNYRNYKLKGGFSY